MTTFLDPDFLLPDPSSRRLFHGYAEPMPIFDFHCHLPAESVEADTRFPTLAHAWLGSDHYKWRAMRANGVPEDDITGHEPDFRTFLAWARTVPRLVGNPLYHWTHLELRRHFGIQERLDEETRPAHLGGLQRPPGHTRVRRPGPCSPRMRVRAVCTTDDPADSLEAHRAYAAAPPAWGSGDGARVPAGTRLWPWPIRPHGTPACTAWRRPRDLSHRQLRPAGAGPGSAPCGLSRSGLPGFGPRPGGAGPRHSRRTGPGGDLHAGPPGRGGAAGPGRGLPHRPAAGGGPHGRPAGAGSCNCTSIPCGASIPPCSDGWGRTPATTPWTRPPWPGPWRPSWTRSRWTDSCPE